MYSREELLHYCKTFVVPKSRSIRKWEEGESFCISFLNPKEEYVLFVGKYLINLLKIECEEHECLKYSYALLTFLMCDNLLDRSIVNSEHDEYFFFRGSFMRKNCYWDLFEDLQSLVKNIQRVYIKCEHLNSDTEVFESGSCNKSCSIYNSNYGCVNCFDCIDCEYCIDCTHCNKCNHCIDCTNCYECNYCNSCKRIRNCIYSENLFRCFRCKYSKQCTLCRTCKDCNQCNNCNFCSQCNNCEKCRTCKYCCDCKECNHCSYVKNGDKCYGIHNKSKEWNNVKEITDIIKDSNYLLPIVKVVDINDEGWRLECTSQEYIIIYDSCGVIRFKGRLTCKNPRKLSVDNMYLCCGSIYNEHGVLTDILYIGRTKKKNQSKCLSIENFCKGNYLCEKLVKKYDLMGNLVYSTI